MNKAIFFIVLFCISIFGDEVYNKNKRANRLYEQEKYEEALKIYEDALLESPGNKKLSMNKGSAYYRLDEFNKAEESYQRAITVDDKKARADLLYNMGNIFNMQGDQLAAGGNPQAMEKFKAARDSYINALDLRPSDRDAKWNLQLTQLKIKEFEKQQQQQQQNNQQNQNQQNQNQQNQKGDKNKKDQQDQKDSQKKEEQNKQQQDNKENQEQQQQKPEPKPKKSEKDMEKEEALRLLRQYADDADELNKPKKQMRAIKGKKIEKDW